MGWGEGGVEGGGAWRERGERGEGGGGSLPIAMSWLFSSGCVCSVSMSEGAGV